MKIGFVGLGIMGHPMALNLIRGGHELFVYGRRRLPPDVHEAGAIVCDTLKAIAERSEIVILMVPDTPDVKSVLFDPQGVAPGGRNYLGYQNPQLDSYFHKMMAHRDFAIVREETQHISALLKDQMPLIPLWQIDTHIAIHESVKCPDLSRLADPLMIFADIEKWRIDRH